MSAVPASASRWPRLRAERSSTMRPAPQHLGLVRMLVHVVVRVAVRRQQLLELLCGKLALGRLRRGRGRAVLLLLLQPAQCLKLIVDRSDELLERVHALVLAIVHPVLALKHGREVSELLEWHVLAKG